MIDITGRKGGLFDALYQATPQQGPMLGLTGGHPVGGEEVITYTGPLTQPATYTLGTPTAYKTNGSIFRSDAPVQRWAQARIRFMPAFPLANSKVNQIFTVNLLPDSGQALILKFIWKSIPQMNRCVLLMESSAINGPIEMGVVYPGEMNELNLDVWLNQVSGELNGYVCPITQIVPTFANLFLWKLELNYDRPPDCRMGYSEIKFGVKVK